MNRKNISIRWMTLIALVTALIVLFGAHSESAHATVEPDTKPSPMV